jgi:hypothetical protein
VRGDVSKALGDREFMDFSGPLVRDAGLVVAAPVPAVRLLVPLLGMLGAVGGALDVFGGDGLALGEVSPPAQQLIGALGRFVTGGVTHVKTLDRFATKSFVDVGRRGRVG